MNISLRTKIISLAVFALISTFSAIVILTALNTERQKNNELSQRENQTLDATLRKLFSIEDSVKKDVCRIEANIESWNAIASGSKTDRVQLKAVFSKDWSSRDVFFDEYANFDCK